MAPTSEERREVAERLRREGRALTTLTLDMGMELASLTLDDAIGIEHNVTWEECFNRLADLIDPTCHNADDGVRGGFVCSECSYHVEQDTMDADFNAWEDLRYCPCCGARVTRGGER